MVSAVKSAASPTVGAVVLQDYAWAHGEGLDELCKLLNEATGTTTWKAVRQWGDGQDANAESLRDAVVLYDRSVYIGTDIEKSSVGAFRDEEDLLAGMQPSIRGQLADFIGRWASAELEVVDSATGTSATGLQFVLVSYHGRKMMKANNDILPVQTTVKASMARDFVSQVADLAVANEASPALIAGSWNIDSVPLTVNGGHKSDGRSKAPWTTTVHLSDAVEKDSIGQPLSQVDYAVAVHPAPGSNANTDLTVTEVVTLSHPADIASHFQHKPLLLKIQVKQRSA